nr:jasmonic acid-amido synthetase JAR1-like isoform X2 [Ipomoea batatas]
MCINVDNHTEKDLLYVSHFKTPRSDGVYLLGAHLVFVQERKVQHSLRPDLIACFPAHLPEDDMTGLYCYRLGDVVKVKGFHNSTPDRAARGTFLLLYVHQHRQSHGEGSPIISEAAAKILADSKLEVVDFTNRSVGVQECVEADIEAKSPASSGRRCRRRRGEVAGEQWPKMWPHFDAGCEVSLPEFQFALRRRLQLGRTVRV